MAITNDEFMELWTAWAQSMEGQIVRGGKVVFAQFSLEINHDVGHALATIMLDLEYDDDSRDNATFTGFYEHTLDIIAGITEMADDHWSLISETIDF